MATLIDESQPLLGGTSSSQEADNKPLTEHDVVVDFDPDGDEDNPLDWPAAYKWGIVALLAFMAFTV